MKRTLSWLLLAPLTLCFILRQPSRIPLQAKDQADTIYYNGNIITMDEQTPIAKMVAVKNGKIIKVSNSTLPRQLESFYRKTKLVNLKKKTMLPGFIDGHSHLSSTAVTVNLNFSISSPPFGNVTSISQMLDNAKRYITENDVPFGQPIYSSGYSDYQVLDHRHPTRYELDWISTDHPIIFGHYSGHAVVANSLALQLIGYTEKKEPPPGGVFDKYPNGTLTGLCKQYAILPLMYAFQVSFGQLSWQQVQKAQQIYFKSGITTAHEIISTLQTAKVFKDLSSKLEIDVNAYLMVSTPQLKSLTQFMTNYTTSRFKPRGAKFIIDGSMQTYTAYLSQPYWVPKAKQYDNLDNYTYDKNRSCYTQSCGQNNFPYKTFLTSLLQKVHNKNYDILTHCNGDKAIDTYLDAIRTVKSSQLGRHKKSQSRFIVVHGQTSREDQLDSMVELGVNPSFFTPHIYYWGDQHYKIFLGPERANRMNPTQSALKRNLSFTLHNDSPVVLMGQTQGRNTFMEIIDSAVNRKTMSGRVLGSDQRISPYEALKAVTINSAWQSREQKIKGSISNGKVADFVILSGNPLTIKPENLHKLSVVGTIKGGKLVYGSYT